VETGAQVPPVYRWLAAQGGGRPLLEWPIAAPVDLRAGYQESRAMYFSTYHWLPLLNGYTAYEPPSHRLFFLLAQRLPAARAVRDLVDLSGVRLLLLHRDRLDPEARARWDAWLATAGQCDRLAEFGPDLVCGLPAAQEDLRPQVIAANAARPRDTFRGRPLEPLPPAGRHGALTVQENAPTLAAGLVVRERVAVSNRSPLGWPGLAPLVPQVVTVRHRWRSASGAAAPPWQAAPLLCDLAPGEDCEVVLPLVAPAAPGDYVLELGLAQEGGDAIALEGPDPLPQRVRVVPFGQRRGG
jgi:hypothetical protein